MISTIEMIALKFEKWKTILSSDLDSEFEVEKFNP